MTHTEHAPASEAPLIRMARAKTRVRLKGAISIDPEPRVLDGGDADSLAASLRMFDMPYARVAAATDKGVEYKDRNEDRVAVYAPGNFVAVVDGMGGYKNGREAADILANALARYPEDPSEAVWDARKRMSHLGSNDGAVFVSGRILVQGNNRRYLEVRQAGDARLLVARPHGSIAFCTKDQGVTQYKVDKGEITPDEALYDRERHLILEYVSKSHGHPYAYRRVLLTKGDRVYLCSDGIGDNLTSQETVDIGKDRNLEQTMRLISDITRDRMQASIRMAAEVTDGRRRREGRFSDGYLLQPKRDNRALAIMDIL